MVFRYSDLYSHTAYQCKISPDCTYLANAVDKRLVIRRHSHDLAIVHIFHCMRTIDLVVWSPDSRYVLNAHYASGTIEVWEVGGTPWHSTIQETASKITSIRWSTDSKTVISACDLRMVFWNLADQRIEYIRYPKFADKGCEPSPDGKYLAIVEMKHGKDHISIYNGSTLVLLTQFATDTVDMENLQWSPDSRYIAVWDDCLYYQLLIYRPDGYLVASYQAYEYGLGIKSVTWSHNSQLLAIGSYDQKIRILSTSSWDVCGILSHPSVQRPTNKAYPIIYEESINLSTTTPSAIPAIEYRQIIRRPFNIPILRPEYNIHHPKTGIGLCQFSADGNMICARNDAMPTTLWLWSTKDMQCCAIIIQQKPIRQALWNPRRFLLAMICGDEHIYIIQHQHQENASHHAIGNIRILPLAVPTSQFNIRKIQWTPEGESLLLLDNNLYCLASLKVPV
ncbi:uncharacterized protein BYT42DRAFT_564009 [Radiomyces spectabilis]|uniref:uncharacterized protein n=1 Tax=Radiomyces spectabilis TaxID=64574 RepID=UPI00221E704B|nr:uncharacterized protein BYT42DRAFT_564009 [Radiomyces spectabilis]KAI8384904.1 hypothetical protein BYT42DRAFT_564009 [Radiomyces spectabilis]